MSDLKILFSNKHEIRMGSPYFIAELTIEGIDIEIPKANWQDKFAISADRKFIILVGFDLAKNEPGFRFHIVDVENKKVVKTKRFRGLVNKMSVKDRKIKFNKFLYSKSESIKNGELCCNTDDEFEIE